MIRPESLREITEQVRHQFGYDTIADYDLKRVLIKAAEAATGGRASACARIHGDHADHVLQKLRELGYTAYEEPSDHPQWVYAWARWADEQLGQ